MARAPSCCAAAPPSLPSSPVPWSQSRVKPVELHSAAEFSVPKEPVGFQAVPCPRGDGGTSWGYVKGGSCLCLLECGTFQVLGETQAGLWQLSCASPPAAGVWSSLLWGMSQFHKVCLSECSVFTSCSSPLPVLPNYWQEAKAEVGVSCSETCLDQTLLRWGVCSHREDLSALHPVFFLAGCSITAVSSLSCARPSLTKLFAHQAKGWATCGRWSCC